MRIRSPGSPPVIANFDVDTIDVIQIASFLGAPSSIVRDALLRFGAHMYVITRDGRPVIEFWTPDVERWLNQRAALDMEITTHPPLPWEPRLDQ